MITVIDLKISNIASVSRALKFLNVEHKVSDRLEDVINCEKMILPGVGSFAEGSSRLKSTGLREAIRKRVIEDKTPILGICLGMQLLASQGEEGGPSEGLDLIKGRVSHLRHSLNGVKLPHIGWNDVSFGNFPVFDNMPAAPCFYFVHSYEFVPDEKVQTATCHYGKDFIAGVQKENILGFQFHPEKSQKAGLKLLENFCKGKY
ncbi:MAG TPA: imidazole glycerol phosphate synthase subunit HisH [Candidatus Omnitrophota bacterium]|nr:imidazole glycerol phosphate synthase subunit HisH [Candidatus Omnitrophota bacterium]